MLRELRIENLLLIERAELRLGPGLNVLTGETGAGKTVLAHSLDLLMGGKAKKGIVRVGAPEAWVEGVFDLPPETKGIAEGTEPDAPRGLNSSGDLKYGGPCPPNGQHRYVFKLYALDSVLGLEEGASKRKIESAMQSHILDQAELVGVYAR